ncbi:MAG: peptidylprolyl isomerase [Sulfurimonadaceae bacterium]|jgi:FKBP-type peptidyl-prolyl cis-trans isomerase SlyD|nr:peptidylprolyl isomerase [Sulfurimonadaceae bacterium]
MSIEKNQIVSIEYEVSDGQSVVDSNVGSDPLVFMFGREQIIPGLENAIKTMQIGERKEVLVKAEEAYGEYNQEALDRVSKDQFAGIDLEVGMSLYGQGEDGSTVQVIVKEINEEDVVVDFNHPLAGKDLTFMVVLNNIREASADEILSGIPVENQVDSCCSDHSNHGCGC